MNLFDHLNSINQTKEYLLVDAQAEKEYAPYMIHRGLSFFADTVMLVNEMNKYQDIPKRWDYDFFMHSVTKKKRFSKWHKKDTESDDLKMIARYFTCSYANARSALNILTQSQLDDIRSITDTGGRR